MNELEELLEELLEESVFEVKEKLTIGYRQYALQGGLCYISFNEAYLEQLFDDV